MAHGLPGVGRVCRPTVWDRDLGLVCGLPESIEPDGFRIDGLCVAVGTTVQFDLGEFVDDSFLKESADA